MDSGKKEMETGSRRRVVITGIGAVTPLGNTAAESWEAAAAGKCGIAPITRFDAAGRKVKLAAEVKNFAPETVLEKSELRRMDDFTVFGAAAAKEAFLDAGLDMSAEDADRAGVIFSSGIGGLGTIERENRRGEEKGFDRVAPHFIPMAITNMAAADIAIRHGFHGVCECVVTACAAGTSALGNAFRQIRDGYQDVMLCGASEAGITPLGMGGFTSMKALSFSEDPSRASIPFDKERSGFVMGEGAGALVLEEYGHAMQRGAKIYCEVAGYGASCDAYHITAPAADGQYAAKCMLNAMKDAGITPEEVDYINAHGTSTPMNDRCETAAVKLAFGEAASRMMISSTKSMTGHLLGASGAVEAVFTALMVKNGLALPTINYREPDPECDLDVVPNEARKAEIRYAMSNSLGFGGHNASVIFKKYDGR